VFHALADPTRRGMVERLVRGPASVSELSRPLAMSLPAVMQHLQVLEASGLVRSEKAGRVRTCRIEPAALRTAEAWITDQRTSWETRLDRLGDYLAGQNADNSQKGQLTDGPQRHARHVHPRAQLPGAPRPGLRGLGRPGREGQVVHAGPRFRARA
jgi:DNA-binding transcriptional ArsR family regulator